MTARFFVLPAAVRNGQVQLDAADSHHLLRVLRARPGTPFVAVAGGTAYDCRLVGSEADLALGEVLAAAPAGGEPPVHITLFQGLAKGDKFDWVLQKGSELGVGSFVPVACARSVVRLEAHKARDRVQRWQAIVREAAQQCRRGAPPTVDAVVDWSVAVARAGEFDLAVVPWEERAGAPGLRALLQDLSGTPAPPRIGIYIGPEGGLTPGEVAMAAAAGARVVGLGPRILRTETAGLAVVAAVLFAIGDLG